MFILQALKKPFAYLFICITVAFGFILAFEFSLKDAFLWILFYCIFGLTPFMLSYLFLDGKKKLRGNFWMRVRQYTVLTLMLPITTSMMDYEINLKRMNVANPKDIHLDIAHKLVVVEILIGFVVFFSFLAIYILGFKVSKSVYITFVISLVLIIFIPYMTKNDYRAIRENGIFISEQGSERLIEWSDIQKVELNSFIHRRSRSHSSHNWEFIFYENGGGKIIFGPFTYYQYALQSSLEIKNKIIEENVPLTVDILTENEWSYVEIDMEYEEGNPADFYSLFELDSKRK